MTGYGDIGAFFCGENTIKHFLRPVVLVRVRFAVKCLLELVVFCEAVFECVA